MLTVFAASRLLLFLLCQCALSSLVKAYVNTNLDPRIGTCSVLDFGAVGDNKTEDTAAVQSALISCKTVIFPSGGLYLVRALNLSALSDLNILIEPNATVIAWPDPYTYNATTGTVLPLFFTDLTPVRNVSIGGGGTIDGQGWRWWKNFVHAQRPILLSIDNGINISVSNLTLVDSPDWNVRLRGSYMRATHLIINSNLANCPRNVTSWPEAPNTDGINIGGSHIYVADSFIHNGDDCIPTNSGVNGSDSFDILVERVTCECGENGAVPILEPGHASIRDVVYRDMVVRYSNQGAGVKIAKKGEGDSVHGSVSNVTWSNITIIEPRYTALYVNVFGETGANCSSQPQPHSDMRVSNITFSGITGTVNASLPAGCFLCSPDAPCDGLTFNQVKLNLTETPGPAPPYICSNVGPSAANSNDWPAPCGSS